LYEKQGYTASLTPLEGPDSPPLSLLSESERRIRELPPDVCYAHHRHPQFNGIACLGSAIQHWDTVSCGLCSPRSDYFADVNRHHLDDNCDISPLTPHSGVFAEGGYYAGLAVPETFYYADGSLIVEAMELVLKNRNEYYSFFERGDYSLPFPSTDWYASAVILADALRIKIPPTPQATVEIPLPVRPNRPERPNQQNRGLGFDARSVNLFPQSGILEEVSQNKTQVLTTFIDDFHHEEASYDQDMDNTHYNVDTDEVSIVKFLSRPIKVFSQIVTVGATAPTAPLFINPSTFFTNKRVMNRINNYRNLKCDLCFRFMINGTPMHYGRWMATAVSNVSNDTLLTPATLVNMTPSRVILSQPPHVFLNPTSCEGGCLRLPYVHHYNAFSTALGEHLTTGFIALTEMSPLRSMSTAQDGVTITALCWAENVVFGAPTSSNLPNLVPQSGDEYGRGIISKPLAVLSDVAGVLSRIASIRPYALASQSILHMGSQIAIALGFSKPALVSDISYMIPRISPNLASAVQHDPIYKMTFDDKQEVTVDPSVVGLARKDDMMLSSIVERESYVTKFEWSSNAIPDFNIFYANVNPTFWANGPGTGAAQQIAMTPLAYTMQAFRQWRGSLRFRFVAVASAFHKGRIRITYDPNGVTASPGLPVEYNTAYTYIWDLAESHEAIIDVGYMSHVPYLRPLRPGLDGVATIYGTVPVNFNPLDSNGHLVLSVVNELTCSNATSTISDIMMFVSAGPDFEMFDPVDAIDNYTMYPQSGQLEVEEHFAKRLKPHVVFGKYIGAKDKAAMVHHGDPVTSLRYLLKRYTSYMSIAFPLVAGASTLLYRLNYSAFPLHRGKAPGAMHLANNIPYNYVYQTPMTWFSTLFLARRGGVRWRLRDESMSGINFTRLKVVRNTISTTAVFGQNPYIPFNSSSDGSKKFITSAPNSGISGMSIGSTNDGLRMHADAEIPFHSPRRFFPCRMGDNSLNHSQGVSVFTAITNTNAATRDGQLAVYISAADDFSLYGFVACPLVYYAPALL
jgi:hypothetical protein